MSEKNFYPKRFRILFVISLMVSVVLGFSACGNSAFDSDAEMQATVRGVYASFDNITVNRGYFLVVEDDNVCSISFLNGVLGQESAPIYTAVSVDHSIERRDYKNGKIITETQTYLCQDVDTNNLSTNIKDDKYTYTKINEAGNIKLQNAEHFRLISANVKNSVWNTQVFSGSFTSDISTKAVLLIVSFYDENYNAIQAIEYDYCYEIAKNSTTSFEVEIAKDVNADTYTIMAYYL